MKSRSVLSVALFLVIGAQVVVAQDYVDPESRYRLTLVGDWRAISYSDAVGRQKTEFVYRDRAEGLLKISREALTGSLADAVRREEENLKIYRTGFESSSIEQFGGGAISGLRLSFFSADGGRKIANTYYYLQDRNAMWVLRFAGRRGMLDTNRNITDQIARSFRVQ